MEVRLNWGFCSDCGSRLVLFRDGNRRQFVVCTHCNFVWELPTDGVAMVAKDATTLDKTVAADVPLEQHQHADHTVLEDNRAISS